MCLSDTAEYWWDVKGYNRKPKHIFTHIKNITCGHYHVYESNDVKDIDCKSCKTILAEMTEIKNQIAVLNEKEMFPNGKCSCGKRFVIRKNKLSGNEFLGCSNYPKCKNTKPLKND